MPQNVVLCPDFNYLCTLKQKQMDISVVIPLFNEEESLPELCAWIDRVMKDNNFTYEIVMVDDGSTDRSWEVIEELHVKNPNIKGIKFRRNYGKSAALNTAFQACQGDVVITMDADLQDSPDEIPELYRMITEEKYDVVGPICESSDCFAKSIDLAGCHRGDLLAIRSAGAYGEAMASTYNLRTLVKGYFSK